MRTYEQSPSNTVRTYLSVIYIAVFNSQFLMVFENGHIMLLVGVETVTLFAIAYFSLVLNKIADPAYAAPLSLAKSPGQLTPVPPNPQ